MKTKTITLKLEIDHNAGELLRIKNLDEISNEIGDLMLADILQDLSLLSYKEASYHFKAFASTVVKGDAPNVTQ